MTSSDFTVRMDFGAHAPRFNKLLSALDTASRDGDLDKPLTELVRVHASQINGCAYCVDMHSQDALRGGDTELRVHGVVAWRHAPYYTPQERAALALTEAITLIAATGRWPQLGL